MDVPVTPDVLYLLVSATAAAGVYHKTHRLEYCRRCMWMSPLLVKHERLSWQVNQTQIGHGFASFIIKPECD